MHIDNCIVFNVYGGVAMYFQVQCIASQDFAGTIHGNVIAALDVDLIVAHKYTVVIAFHVLVKGALLVNFHECTSTMIQMYAFPLWCIIHFNDMTAFAFYHVVEGIACAVGTLGFGPGRAAIGSWNTGLALLSLGLHQSAAGIAGGQFVGVRSFLIITLGIGAVGIGKGRRIAQLGIVQRLIQRCGLWVGLIGIAAGRAAGCDTCSSQELGYAFTASSTGFPALAVSIDLAQDLLTYFAFSANVATTGYYAGGQQIGIGLSAARIAHTSESGSYIACR